MEMQRAHLSVVQKKMKLVALSSMISGIICIDKKDAMGAQEGGNGCIQQLCVLVQAEAVEDLLSYSRR